MPLPNYFTPKRRTIDLAKVTAGMTRSEILSELDQCARFVVFQYVLSFILITQRFNSKAIFLKPGEKIGVRGLPYTFLTFLLDWWGFPYGIVYSLETIPQNLRGGTDITDKVRTAIEPNP